MKFFLETVAYTMLWIVLILGCIYVGVGLRNENEARGHNALYVRFYGE